jgi:hypothetical protein
MSNELIPYDQMKMMATDVVASQLFPSLKKPEQVMTLMMLCQAEGLPPIKALQQYHVINGTPSKKADTLLAEFKARGGRVKFTKYSDEIVEGEFKSPDGSEITAAWTIERARKAGLDKRENWIKYPRAMLRARLISEMVTTLMPEIKAGLKIYEEVIDEMPSEIKSPIETDVEVVETEQPKQKRIRKVITGTDDNLDEVINIPVNLSKRKSSTVEQDVAEVVSTIATTLELTPEQLNEPIPEPEPLPEMQVPEELTVDFDGVF